MRSRATNWPRYRRDRRGWPISSDPGQRPRVTVAIATYNAQAHLHAAVASALAQTLAGIEIVIVDDCSTDGTMALATDLARADARIVVDQLASNGGPAVARNRALTLARGEWFAVLDSDDLYAPDRLERLVAVADRVGADIVVDDLAVFDDVDSAHATSFLGKHARAGWIDHAGYLQRTRMYDAGPNLGYLKPVIRTDRLREFDLRYDPRLRIAEDEDFVLRMLAAGLRYWLEPQPGYAYRRHGNSTSHRLSSSNASAMLAASARMVAAEVAAPADILALLGARHAGFARSEAFARLIDALKARRAASALTIMARTPATIPMLRMPIGAALRRIAGRPATSMITKADPAAAAVVAAALAVTRGRA
ncbi:glycosyltransferase family 2 protein [Sphingomonas sp. M1A8_2b]